MTERPTPRPRSWRATSDNWALCKSADSQAVGWAVLRYRLLDWAPIVERPAKCRVRTDANEALGCDDPAMRPTLLIVDDHAGFRVSARRLLEADGFAVVGDAEGVGLALSAVATLSPDVVLVDIGLPDGDGFDLCAAIVAGHDAVVVLTSSRPIVGLQDRLELSGARGFIPKSELSGMAIRALTG